MLEEIRNFLQQLISEETLNTILMYLERAKEAILYLIARLTELKDWLFSFFVR